MTKGLRPLVCTAVLLTASLAAAPVLAQKSGGVLKVHHQDSPASMSIIEEATYSTVVPMMGVFNNLVMAHASSSNSAFASLRSCVSKPSVNQP
jgi:peptide/nickel transport system substrate-binding protein